MAIVAILLVNMLIAMMGNTYQKIAETKNEWQRQVRIFTATASKHFYNIIMLNAVGAHRASGGERSAASRAPEKADGLFAANGRRKTCAGPETQSIGIFAKAEFM